MTSDDVIRAVIQRIDEHQDGLWWDDVGFLANTLARDGLLADTLPPEPLPDGQRRADPFGASETVVKVRGFWISTEGKPARRDDEVRDWPILVPETDLEDLCAERDRLAARVAELEATERCAVDTESLSRSIDVAWEEWFKNFDDERRASEAIADAIREHQQRPHEQVG